MDHKAVLEILCRVCGRIAITKTQKTKYNCTDFLELSTVFGLSVDEDDPLKHPAHFCHACKIVMGKAISKPHFRHQTSTFEGWCTHHEEDCTVWSVADPPAMEGLQSPCDKQLPTFTRYSRTTQQH